MSSMRFASPLASRYTAASGAFTFSPGFASSPANGVPYATYLLEGPPKGGRHVRYSLDGPPEGGRHIGIAAPSRRTYEISSVSSVASGGASRAIVVFPAPETPENRNARPFRTALLACSR